MLGKVKCNVVLCIRLIISIGLIKDIRTADKQIKDLKGAVDMVILEWHCMHVLGFLMLFNRLIAIARSSSILTVTS